MIGGIIGTDIVRYDIYGKDVLIANKMESNGELGHVVVSSATKNLIEVRYKNMFRFSFYKDVVINSNEETIQAFKVFERDDDNI